jgi:hypothetical protein
VLPSVSNSKTTVAGDKWEKSKHCKVCNKILQLQLKQEDILGTSRLPIMRCSSLPFPHFIFSHISICFCLHNKYMAIFLSDTENTATDSTDKIQLLTVLTKYSSWQYWQYRATGSTDKIQLLTVLTKYSYWQYWQYTGTGSTDKIFMEAEKFIFMLWWRVYSGSRISITFTYAANGLQVQYLVRQSGTHCHLLIAHKHQAQQISLFHHAFQFTI